MAIKVIEELKKEVETLKTELQEQMEANAEVKELADKIADLDRKTKEVSTKEDVNIKDLQKEATNLMIKSVVLGKPVTEVKGYDKLALTIEKAIKPSDVSNWVAEAFSKELIDLVELELKVEKLFDSIVVPKGVGSLSLPRKTARTTAFRIQPDTNAIASVISGDKVTFKPEKLKTLVELTDEADNEAVLSTLYDYIKADIAYSLAKGIEEAIVNGDTTGGLQGGLDQNAVTSAFDGLRKLGDAQKVDNGGGAITLDNIRLARKNLGVFGVNPSEVVLLVNPNVYYQLVALDKGFDVIGKAGYKGDLTGQVGFVDGMAVVISETIPTNLDANGVAGGDLTAAVLFNRKAFLVAKRNEVSAERDRNIYKDVDVLVGRVYRDFKQITTGTPAVTITNIAK